MACARSDLVDAVATRLEMRKQATVGSLLLEHPANDVTAALERKVERYVRLLAPLAFVSPRLVSAIIDGLSKP